MVSVSWSVASVIPPLLFIRFQSEKIIFSELLSEITSGKIENISEKHGVPCPRKRSNDKIYNEYIIRAQPILKEFPQFEIPLYYHILICNLDFYFDTGITKEIGSETFVPSFISF